LRDEKVKVIDVELDFVFDSHEGFPRAFSKEFGVTPHKYSKKYTLVYLFIPNYIRKRYLYFLNGGLGCAKVSDGATGVSRLHRSAPGPPNKQIENMFVVIIMALGLSLRHFSLKYRKGSQEPVALFSIIKSGWCHVP
jgi:hypothetical protein